MLQLMGGFKRAFPFLAVLVGLAVTVLSLLGKDGIEKQRSMERVLENERGRNSELKQYVQSLKEKIYSVETDNRELEKTARNKLGMARPGEMIFFFEKDSENDPE